jgi:hypothetical protein
MNGSPGRTFSIGLQAGRLEGVALPDLLWALCRAGKTGVVRFLHKHLEKKVYLDAGNIVFAGSNARDDRLGDQLLRQGRISLNDLDAAVEQIGSGKRIGTLLVEQGALTPEDLVAGVLTQVKRIVLELFEWEEGEYHFEEGPLPTEELITLNISTGELLLSGIRSILSFARIRRSVGTPRTMYGLCEGWRDSLDGVRLSEGEELLIVRLEQGDESVEGLCREVFLSNFEIFQTLWGLKVLGVVEEKVSLAESGEAEWQGSLAETHFADVLVGVAHRGETGILHVSQRMRERTFHFQDGLCVFATSNDTDDGLIAYLLRRGVISLNDREETAKRLLSNKRVGTILRELGVIDERDLEEMVRQQLSEIVYDTFRWSDGDFAFYPGVLPSNEEIKLDTPVESLVAGGIRRVPSWTRVIEGCGGMNYRLSLSERYLDVLDGLDAGAEEWQVVNALKEPRAAREIAAEVALPDFRVCQILWTLRVLRAVEFAPLGQEVQANDGPAQSIPVDIVELDRPPLVEQPVEEEALYVEVVEDDAYEAEDHAGDEEAPAGESVELETAPHEPEPVEAATDEGESLTVDVIDENEEPVATEADGTSATIPVHEESEEAVEISVAHAGTDDEVQDEFDQADDLEEAEDHTVELASDEQADEDLEVEVVDSDFAADDDAEDESAVDPQVQELEDSTRTMRMSREDVDAALRGPADDEDFGEQGFEWEPPEDLDLSISRFNAMQRLVYRTVRSEVGAGAANFIRSCCDEDSGPNPIEGAELHSDGTWDSEGLRRQVVEHRIEDPWELYRQLIDRELDVLRSHVGEAKIVELQRQVEKVSDTHAP